MTTEQILQELYQRRGKQVSMETLQIEIGSDIQRMRPAVEDLKTRGLILEEEYCLEITSKGLDYARSRWV